MTDKKDEVPVKLTKYTFDLEEVTKSYKHFVARKDEVEKKLLQVAISDELTLNAARTTLGKGKDLLKEINEFSDSLKRPFAETKSRIETYQKSFVAVLAKNVEIASGRILNYQTIEAEKARELEQKRLDELTAESDKDAADFERLNRLCVTSICRIFGGNCMVGGKETIFSPLSDEKECQHMRMVFEQKFPAPETFGKFAGNMAVIRELSINAINAIEIGYRNKNSLELALEKKLLEEKFDKELEKERKRVDKEKTKKEKEISSVAKMAMAGTRKTIEYTVIDISKVPLTFLAVDENAVAQYIAANREELKKELADAERSGEKFVERIAGIKFFNNVSVVKTK